MVKQATVCGFTWTTVYKGGRNKLHHTCGARLNPKTLDHWGDHVCDQKHKRDCTATHSH